MTGSAIAVRKFYASLGCGDMSAALALLDADVEWQEAERSPYYSGTVRGVTAVVTTVFEPINRDFEDFTCTSSDFLTDADRTIALGLYTGRAKSGGGKPCAPFVHVWTVRDGMIVGFIQYTDSAAWAEAASGSGLRAGAKPAFF